MDAVSGEKPSARSGAFQRGPEFGFAARTGQPYIVRALLDRDACEPIEGMGRGALFTFPAGSGQAVLREYRRGGALQRFLHEGMLTNRPLREWRVVNRLYESGFPVPEPIGVVWRRRRFLYTGAIATRRVSAVTLTQCLNESNAGPALLEEIGRLIRRMHDLFVYHADLHSGNILVAPQPGGERQVYFVDFDNARLTAMSELQRARNLLRLRRSFLKRGLRLTDFDLIVRGYGPIAFPAWLVLAYAVRGTVSDVMRRPSGHAC